MYRYINLLFVVIFVLNVRQISTATCDIDHPCPQGLECRFVSYLPGTKACVYKSAFTNDTPSKRKGRCPTKGFIQYVNSMSSPCNSNQDCPANKKCCPLSYGGIAYCVDAITVNGQPTITPIIVGAYKTVNDAYDFVGSVTLVQSNGYNILVDSGTPRMTEELLKNLWSKAGLTPEDIDILVTTHGHPDHFASLEVFSNIPQVFSGFISNGHLFKPNPLSNNEQYFLNNDRNVEIIETKGHTLQDISVIVRNVPSYNTVAIVGDLVFAKDVPDSFAQSKELSNESVKKVICTVDYIVPGHGPMYEVDADQKSKVNCTTS